MKVKFVKTCRCSYGVFPAGREVDLPKSMLDIIDKSCYEQLEKSEPAANSETKKSKKAR